MRSGVAGRRKLGDGVPWAGGSGQIHTASKVGVPRPPEKLVGRRDETGILAQAWRLHPPEATPWPQVRYDDWFLASSCKSASRTPIWRSGSGQLAHFERAVSH